MPISNTQLLFGLIKSLTKADKRNFKLYAKRIQGDESMKFIQLFEVMDKLKELDEERILKKLDGIDRAQFSNLKRHLYKQILTSLRLIHITRIKSIEIREQIDFAHVLYSKGLYQQSLKILQRAKRIADENDLDLLVLEIIEFQKIIESRHITHTGPIKNDALTVEARDRLDKVYKSVVLSNLRVRLHGYYIANSHVKNEQEKGEIMKFFNENMSSINYSALGDLDRVYLYQSYVWYYYILLDFHKCFEYARRWVQTIEANQDLMRQDPDLYMRGFHYLLTAAHNLGDLENLVYYLDILERFRKSNYAKFNENSKIFSFLYVHWARFNVHFLKGTFGDGLQLIPRTMRRINRYRERIAPHRIMVLYYKIAWMYLANGDSGKAITYINKILNEGQGHFRADIQAYTRLLFLMAHYDDDNIDLLPYLVNTTDSFFKKSIVRNKLQDATLSFFKKVGTVSISKRHQMLVDFKETLEEIRKDPYEQRAFSYLDIYSWTRAKIERKPVAAIVRSEPVIHA